MSEPVGTNAPVIETPPVNADSMSALEARIKAAEAQPSGRDHRLMGENPTSEVQVQMPINPEPPKEAPQEPKAQEQGKNDGLKQVKDKGGEVSTEELRKRNEHLERGIKEKEELIRKNKELLSKFTKTAQEAKKTEVPKAGFQIPESGFDPEFRKQWLADIEKDPTHILDYQELIVKRELEGIKNERAREREEREMLSRGEELDQLVKSGHDWILKEGLGKFEEVFQRKPFLLQSQTPYMDALRFIDVPQMAGTPIPAQNGPSTPILGAGHAMPPPSSSPPITPEQKMEDISARMRLAAGMKDMKLANELMLEYDRLYRAQNAHQTYFNR